MTKLLLLVVLAIGCSSPKSNPPPPVGGGGSDTAGGGGTEPNHAACASSEDCVVVETKCCDHCNGGKAEAFNKAHADAHRPTGCEATACTELACGKAMAKCEAGICTVTIGPL